MARVAKEKEKKKFYVTRKENLEQKRSKISEVNLGYKVKNMTGKKERKLKEGTRILESTRLLVFGAGREGDGGRGKKEKGKWEIVVGRIEGELDLEGALSD